MNLQKLAVTKCLIMRIHLNKDNHLRIENYKKVLLILTKPLLNLKTVHHIEEKLKTD